MDDKKKLESWVRNVWNRSISYAGLESLVESAYRLGQQSQQKEK